MPSAASCCVHDVGCMSSLRRTCTAKDTCAACLCIALELLSRHCIVVLCIMVIVAGVSSAVAVRSALHLTGAGAFEDQFVACIGTVMAYGPGTMLCHCCQSVGMPA
jgi:hypothetical protein